VQSLVVGYLASRTSGLNDRETEDRINGRKT